MTIFQTLKAIKRGCWYSVPADIYATAFISVDSTEAGKQLTRLRNHWAKQDAVTEFEFGTSIEMPVWDSMELRMVVRQLITVKMMNDRIKDIKKEMF